MIACGTEDEAGTTTKEDGVKSTNTIDAKQTQDLKNTIADLKKELELKDSLIINYYKAYIDEIESNLLKIQGKQTLIMNQKANPEMLSISNPNLIQEIEDLGSLLSENQQKLSSLKSQLKNSNIQLGAYEETIMTLSEEVEMKNMEVFQLQQELENVDAAFGELFEAFQEQSVELEEANADLNTAFYALGTKKELLDNNVISTEGGVLGIGKNKELSSNLNKSYFTQIDITEITEIPLGYDKVELTSTHPESSYEFKEGEKVEKLVIKDAEAFWSISKYLVIVVK